MGGLKICVDVFVGINTGNILGDKKISLVNYVLVICIAQEKTWV